MLTKKRFDGKGPKFICLFASDDLIEEKDDIVLKGVLSGHLNTSHRASHAITDEMFDDSCTADGKNETSSPFVRHQAAQTSKMTHIETVWMQLTCIHEIEELMFEFVPFTPLFRTICGTKTCP